MPQRYKVRPVKMQGRISSSANLSYTTVSLGYCLMISSLDVCAEEKSVFVRCPQSMDCLSLVYIYRVRMNNLLLRLPLYHKQCRFLFTTKK